MSEQDTTELFDATSFGFAATSNRRCRLVNKFTTVTKQTTQRCDCGHNFTL